MSKILAIRFSALGDVAMTLPVVYAVAKANPQHRFTLLSRPYIGELTGNAPGNVNFIGIDPHSYNGLRGAWRLYRRLRGEGIDAVADLHDVLRSKLLRLLFRCSGVRTAHIDKGHRERRRLTSLGHLRMHQLRTSPERYADVFRSLGCDIPAIEGAIYPRRMELNTDLARQLGGWPERLVGVAPFAAHEGKIYPMPLLRQVVQMLSERGDTQIILFGAGERERQTCEALEADYPRVCSLVGRYKLHDELRLMSHLDAMVTMDSSNMHMAALTGTPTVSIWGATHRFAGFAGLQAEGSETVEATMDCRPCSAFGNKPCRIGGYACLHAIPPRAVAQAVERILEKGDRHG